MRSLAVAAVGMSLLGTACFGYGGDGAEMSKEERIIELYAESRQAFPEASEITVEELLALDDVVLVDVREDREQQVSMIPGAVSREAFERDKAAHAGRRVVAYCTIGHRSGLYTAELRREGFEAFNLVGSILSWTHAGQALVGPEGETRRLHVYGERWDLAADGYETVW